MGDIFDLDADGAQALDEQARLNPLDLSQLPKEAWAGSGDALKSLLRPSAGAGRTILMAGAPFAMLSDKVESMVTGQRTTRQQDLYFADVDRFGTRAVDEWTADPESMGSASKTLSVFGNVAGSIPQMVGMPSVFLANAGMDPAVDLINQGVDTKTAMGVGAVNLGVNALGMRLPAAFGTTLTARVATGAGSNLALGVGADAASGEILSSQGYADRAAAYDAADPWARGLDLLMGAAFGWKANIDAPRAMTPSQRDAVLVVNNQDHAARRTMPGEPRTQAAAKAHNASFERSLAQLIAGEPVNVADAINPEDFILKPEFQPRPAASASGSSPANEGAGDSYARMLVALESGGQADARAATSSATGLHQFTTATWLRTVRKAAPAWAQGLTDAQILAQRTDPARSAEMEGVLRAENAAALQAAGQDAGDPFNLYAAHHFGAGKGVAFARAAGDTPMSAILTEGQLNANPYLRGLTKDQAIANWRERAGRAGVDVVARADAGPSDDPYVDEMTRIAAQETAPRAAEPAAVDPLAPLPGSASFDEFTAWTDARRSADLPAAVDSLRADLPRYERDAADAAEQARLRPNDETATRYAREQQVQQDDLRARLADAEAGKLRPIEPDVMRASYERWRTSRGGEAPASAARSEAAAPAAAAPARATPRAAAARAAGEVPDSRAAQSKDAPETPAAAAQRMAQEQPEAPVLDGFDADGAPRYRPFSEVAAEIEAERAQAERNASAFHAAANCAQRRGAHAA